MMFARVNVFFFFKQKTAYEMRISDWSSDVCSSDLRFYARRQSAPLWWTGRDWREKAIIAQRIVANAEQEGLRRIDYSAGLRPLPRSEERRVGKECVSTCRSRWSPYH